MRLSLRPENICNPLNMCKLFCRVLLMLMIVLVQLKPLHAQQKPNIIFILADDMGYGSFGAFGQDKIRTPNIDQMAREGMILTDFYANSICAPSRASLINGLSTARSMVRDNYELGGFEDSTEFGQMPLPANTLTLGKVLQKSGYTTGLFGKWGLGGPGSSGIPNKQGFDFFYGYLDQKQAHNHYPTHLWRNTSWEPLPNPAFRAHQKLGAGKDPDDPKSYKEYSGTVYASDTITSEALKFMRQHQSKPFFMYMAYTLPHLALQVPEKYLQPYIGKFNEQPHSGTYLPNRTPLSTYAAMISLLDEYVGRILQELKALGLDKQTLVIFTTDNGAAGGGINTDYFNASGKLRGKKGGLYEGGIRVPFVARWPGKIRPESRSAHIAAIWDMLPTFAELSGSKMPEGIDGISMLPTFLNSRKQTAHEYLYWEIHGAMRGMQAVRFGPWKAVKKGLHVNPDTPIELYNLENDLAEQHNVADRYPDLVKKAGEYMGKRELAVLQQWNYYNPKQPAND